MKHVFMSIISTLIDTMPMGLTVVKDMQNLLAKDTGLISASVLCACVVFLAYIRLVYYTVHHRDHMAALMLI